MWYEEMSRSVNQKVVTILIGNKLDMDSRRVVSTQEGRQLGKHIVKKLKNIKFLSLKHRLNLAKMLMIFLKI